MSLLFLIVSVVYACTHLCACMCAYTCVGIGVHACGGQRSTLCLLHVVFHIHTNTQAYTDGFLLKLILSWVWSSTEVLLSLPPFAWSSRCMHLHPGFHPGWCLGSPWGLHAWRAGAFLIGLFPSTWTRNSEVKHSLRRG